MRREQQPNMCKRGFTLIELLVAIAIIGIILPALYGTILSLYETHAYTLSRALALSGTTKAVKEMVRDVRSAVYAENGALPIATIATSTFILYVDTDFDGRVERVRYFLDGDVVRKGIVEPSATSSYDVGTESVDELATGIINGDDATPLFRYYTATSTEITSPTATLDVRRVEIRLRAESSFGRETGQVELQSSASIRNLKDQY